MILKFLVSRQPAGWIPGYDRIRMPYFKMKCLFKNHPSAEVIGQGLLFREENREKVDRTVMTYQFCLNMALIG